MSVTSIATRYARSILGLASEQGVMTEVVADMESFSQALQNRDLVLLIKSPIIKSDKKQKIFDVLFKSHFQRLTTAFFGIVIRKNREQYLPEIVGEVIRQYKKLKNITTAHLTTAVEISPATLHKIENALSSTDNVTGDLELSTNVDSKIIGGFIIELEGLVYDASIKEKLVSLKQEILDNSYIKQL